MTHTRTELRRGMRLIYKAAHTRYISEDLCWLHVHQFCRVHTNYSSHAPVNHHQHVLNHYHIPEVSGFAEPSTSG